MPSVAVVYLDRFGNAKRFAEAFLRSATQNAPGAAYDLIWQAKGYPAGTENPLPAAFAARLPGALHHLTYSDDLYQFSLAFDAARKFPHDRFLFFVSWSRILAPNWLRFYLEAFERNPDCGVVGATGSYERASPEQLFPNVHIRTNAFMIAREVFLSLDPGKLEAKSDGNRFEAGDNSLTQQIRARGLAPIVIDRWGKTYRWPEWPTARVFRSSQQQGLLVADNQTHDYAVSKLKRRRKQVRAAWGPDAPVTAPSLSARLGEAIAWRYPRLNRPRARSDAIPGP